MVLAAVLALLFSAGAAAQLSFHDPATNQGILDHVVSEFATRAGGWRSIIMDAANRLFWTLGTISLVWTAGTMILRKSDIGEFFAEFFRFIMFFGFFLWLLRNGPEMADAIVRSLRQLGETAIGVTGLSPSGIVDVGFMIWKQAMSNLSAWQPIDSVVGVSLSAGILILLAVIAINMLLLLVAAWFLAYAGIFFLGFGGSRWTSDMAIHYYKTVLGVAVQLFTMVLLVGIGADLLTAFYGRMSKGTLNFDELGVMLVFCIALLMLVNRVPPLLAGIITGSGIGTAGGIGNFGVGAVAGAAFGAAGMTSAAASMASAAFVGGAQNIAGGASAIMAAITQANHNVTAGSDLLSDLGGGAGCGGAGGDDVTGSGDTPLARAAGFGGISRARASTGAMGRRSGAGIANGSDSTSGHVGAASKQAASSANSGGIERDRQGNAVGSRDFLAGAFAGLVTAGRVAVDAGANLAAGTAAVAKGKAGERIAHTVGGRIAAAITATANADATAFSEGGLSADRNAEVAAFVRRGGDTKSA